MSVGYEHIDLQACRDKGVAVTNTPNVSSDSVSELTVSLVLLTARRLLEGTDEGEDTTVPSTRSP
jgi:lactate dehydrogenase-like 2-hydroxyacid dehydrogenase